MTKINFDLHSDLRDSHIRQLLDMDIHDPIVIVNCSIAIPKARLAIGTPTYQSKLSVAIGWEWYAIQPQLLNPIPHIVFAHVDGIIKEIVWAEEWQVGSKLDRVFFVPVFQHAELSRFELCKEKDIKKALPPVLSHSAFYFNC